MRLIICSKSPWRPSIRREHAIARCAAGEGVEVVFIERARDVRRAGSTTWAAGWHVRADAHAPGVAVVAQSTLVPGHRSDAAQLADAWRLRRTLRTLGAGPGTAVVATAPWQWPAVSACRGARRVADLADDWRALIPGRAGAFERLHARIAAEADVVVLASAALAPAFAGAEVAVVANGVDAALVAVPASPPPARRRLVYAGTLSERFDAPLLATALDRLPGWELELYGECQYAGGGAAPELAALLSRTGVTWHAAVQRDALPGVLDRARVLVAPHRITADRGQDSMKLYDYAARRRPIVATPGALGAPAHTAGAGVREAAGPDAFAAAVLAAADAPAHPGLDAWLADHTWSRSWERWRAAVLEPRR